MKGHVYTAVIERDTATGFYVAYVPDLPGAHTQAETLEELQENLKEVVELVLEDADLSKPESKFIEPISNLHPPQTDKQTGQINNGLKHALLPLPAVA